ncbi:hypothetical protein GGS23DRAFT_577449 [Durotheca rogersii]|uniref:uncharacterized protein n=1 Tax=Durotheca rogersii TaxID=419775 RepID=UPI00221FCCC8|nr:uncharacterized protein GGS23DRAFT_577449 [Durotheca rogersii]KAI5861171.1 hypothetical protein GGS23DRAFT_577449 [Durotheca rogersii]
MLTRLCFDPRFSLSFSLSSPRPQLGHLGVCLLPTQALLACVLRFPGGQVHRAGPARRSTAGTLLLPPPLPTYAPRRRGARCLRAYIPARRLCVRVLRVAHLPTCLRNVCVSACYARAHAGTARRASAARGWLAGGRVKTGGERRGGGQARELT